MCKGSSAAGGEGLFFVEFAFLQPLRLVPRHLPLHRGGFFKFCFNETASAFTKSCIILRLAGESDKVVPKGFVNVVSVFSPRGGS